MINHSQCNDRHLCTLTLWGGPEIPGSYSQPTSSWALAAPSASDPPSPLEASSTLRWTSRYVLLIMRRIQFPCLQRRSCNVICQLLSLYLWVYPSLRIACSVHIPYWEDIHSHIFPHNAKMMNYYNGGANDLLAIVLTCACGITSHLNLPRSKSICVSLRCSSVRSSPFRPAQYTSPISRCSICAQRTHCSPTTSAIGLASSEIPFVLFLIIWWLLDSLYQPLLPNSWSESHTLPCRVFPLLHPW